jgi:hypothetical protein
MHEWPILVISSGARDLAFSATCEEKISRLARNHSCDTVSLRGRKESGALPDELPNRSEYRVFGLEANAFLAALVRGHLELATDARKPLSSLTRPGSR